MAKRKVSRSLTPPRPSAGWSPAVLGLAAVSFAVYANGIGNGFVGDDKFQLLRNPLVTDPGKIPQILGSSVWSFLGLTANYYRPLQFLIYMLLYEAAGFRAPAFHLFMVLLHAVNTVLLFLLVKRLAARRIALAAAVLFAVHPVHTEVVDWVAALPDLMLTTLVLAGLIVLARQTTPLRPLQILGHCGFYLAALLTKETGVMLLPLYAAYGFFLSGRRWSELRRNAGLYAAMAATFVLYLVMRVAALGSLAPGQQAVYHLSPAAFALSATVIAAHYLGMLLLPVNLNYFHIFYPTHAVTLEFLLSAIVLAGLLVGFLRIQTALLSFGLFWMAITLVPALNLTGVGQNVFAERYLYLPSAGFCWITGWAWDRLASRRLSWAKWAGALVLVACVAEVLARNSDWRNTFTMVQVTLRQSPASGAMHDALAAEYVEQNAFEKAKEQEQLAVQYEPGRPAFHTKLGYLLLKTHGENPRAAITEFQKVVDLEPAAASGYSDLGMAFEASGDSRQAADAYQKALQLEPQLPEAKQGYERTVTNLR